MNEVKEGKLHIIASYTFNNLCNFKIASRGQKHGSFLLNCTNIPSIVLCWKSQLWVDFKIRISIASQEKENKVLYIANEEMGGTTFNAQ